MAISVLDRSPGPPVVEQCVTRWVAEAAECLVRAGGAAVEATGDQALGEAVAGLAELESRAVALRLALSAEADRRRVAEQTAETGTDAWLARLTGTSREVAAGGLWIARLLQTRYAATREAFAAGSLRVEQVRVILNAAEQAPVEATPEQVRRAEEWLVARATGVGTRSGRPMEAKRLRQAARRMFAAIDHDLADRHETILLGRETRTAEAETFLALQDNGDGTFSGKFRIPELHGHLLHHALDRLTSPRRLGRDKTGHPVVDEAAPGHNWGANVYETHGAALCELIEHLPTHGWPGHGGNACEILVKIDLDALLTGLGAAGLDTGVAMTAGQARRLACHAGLTPRSSTVTRSRWTSAGNGDCTPVPNDAPCPWPTTCAVAGCRRPFAWCEVHHHRLSWTRGGPTDLDNGLPCAATTTDAPTTPASTSDNDPTASGPSTHAREAGRSVRGRVQAAAFLHLVCQPGG